jgi:hypothetical protein
LGGTLKGFLGGFVLGRQHQLGEELSEEISIEFRWEVGSVDWHGGLSMHDFWAEVDCPYRVRYVSLPFPVYALRG